MIKLIVLWSRPADEAAFESYYGNIHVPLARKCPGVRAIETLQVSKGDICRVASLTYDSSAELRSSFESPEGKALTADSEIMKQRFNVTSTLLVGRPDL